jgi:hypothetical protein
LTVNLMSMDINELRGWAAFMDKAAIASLVVTIVAVATLGVTTWLSFRFNGAMRAHDQAAFDRYKGTESERVTALEHQVATARERVATLEHEAAAARQRAEAFGQAAREANERAAQADARAERETAAANAKERAAELDAAEIRQRLAELGKQVKEATANATASAAATDKPPSPIVAALHKYAGTKAAVFVVDQVSDAPAAGAVLSGWLSEAGWASQTWKWSGVAGITGVVVLVREGSDPATDQAASTLVEQLGANGFSATKAGWPGNWRRFRGLLDGPQTPDPTEAPIRIVIGAKPR